jgi:4-aminobutyrate aminotransferase-like enzyme
VVERMRDHRVLIGTEGHDNNVLKVRPPLSFDEAASARFVECLRRVLGERGAQP